MLADHRPRNRSAKWPKSSDGEFFDIDLEKSTLWLNNRYRNLFAPQGSGLNDAPVLKALMFLLTHQIFESAHLSPKDRNKIALWRAILSAAVTSEEEMRNE